MRTSYFVVQLWELDCAGADGVCRWLHQGNGEADSWSRENLRRGRRRGDANLTHENRDRCTLDQLLGMRRVLQGGSVICGTFSKLRVCLCALPVD